MSDSRSGASAPPHESPEARQKRLLMRAHRRGIREMDLILGPFAAAHLASMPPDELRLFEALLEENDQDLYAWIAGRPDAADPSAGPGTASGDASGPLPLRPLLDRIAAFALQAGAVPRGA